MSQTHAPGEWRKVLEHIPYSESFRIVDEGTIVAHGVNLKNAERIVLCCNAHDDLVAALRACLLRFESLNGQVSYEVWQGNYDAVQAATNALAKAGEK